MHGQKTTKAVTKAADSKKADKPVEIAPVVNLANTAKSAARLLAARKLRAATASNADTASAGVNASALKQLKNNLTQPQYAPTSPLAGLNKQPKPTGQAGYARVGGQHQNASANVARTGVPRRTSGG